MSANRADLGRVLVVTGTIGSGKSTASGILAELGAEVISADSVAREVVAPASSGLAAVVDVFGKEILNAEGALDRAALATKVFSSVEARKKLEMILHPLIEAETEKKIASMQAAGAPLVVYDCPLYFEAGLEKRGFGAVLHVSASPEVTEARLAARDGLSQEQIEQRRESQLPDEKKRAGADFVVENNGSIDQLRDKLQALAPRLFAIGAESV